MKLDPYTLDPDFRIVLDNLGDPLEFIFRLVCERTKVVDECWEADFEPSQLYKRVRADHELVKLNRLTYATFINPWLPLVGANDGSVLLVRHTCDNPPCWRPCHLVCGTHTDNIRDMYERNRSGRGADLILDSIDEIKELSEVLTVRELKALYGVSGTAIRSILSGRRRKNI